MKRVWIDQLLNPATYPDATETVQHLQTHISHIFLTDGFAYKIKKPVDFGFLNFTTLEKRYFYCLEELRLNRRLSPDIYLELVQLRDDGAGGITFSGEGAVVEYAVKMVRMPEERIMSRMLGRNEVTVEHIDAIARKVAAFHAAAQCGGGIDLFGSVEALRNNWLENLQQTRPYLGRTLSVSDHELIGNRVLDLLETAAATVHERVVQGFIRECDGDLHTENICLDGQVHIFDCIEFNEKFRYSDTAADIAFLAMDLENHGRRDLAERFVETYGLLSEDRGLLRVLPIYLANRAFIRGKVESFRLDDPLIGDDQKSSACIRARRFFRLARGYLLRERLPLTLFLTCGPTGSGKSAVAGELAFQLGLNHISSDVERKQLAGVEPTQRGCAIYSQDWHQATYDRLLQLAQSSLASGVSVVVDATFRSSVERRRFIRMAAEIGASAVILNLCCPPDLVRQRLEARQASGDGVSDGTWQVYQKQIDDFEFPTSDEALLLDLDAVLDLPEMVNRIAGKTGLLI